MQSKVEGLQRQGGCNFVLLQWLPRWQLQKHKVAVEQVFSGSGLLLPQTSAISCCDGSRGRVLKKAEKDIFVAACKFCTAKQQNITAFTINFLDFSLKQ